MTPAITRTAAEPRATGWAAPAMKESPVTVPLPPPDSSEVPGGRLTFDQYRARPGLNWSKLRPLRTSPLHYQHALKHEREDTDTLAKGRAMHTATLEPERLETDFAVWDGGPRRGAEWTAFKATHAGRTIIKLEDFDRARAMGDALRRHAEARRYIEAPGPVEESIFWTDPRTTIACKGRVDKGCDFAIVDLKSARSIDARRFATQAFDLGYHCQLAFYQRGWAETHGGLCLPPVLIAVEGEAPHDVAVFRPDEDFLAKGVEEIDELLALLARCKAAKSWPGRYPEETDLALPGWATIVRDAMESSVVDDVPVAE